MVNYVKRKAFTWIIMNMSYFCKKFKHRINVTLNKYFNSQ